jgi:hypothetical protein
VNHAQNFTALSQSELKKNININLNIANLFDIIFQFKFGKEPSSIQLLGRKV